MKKRKQCAVLPVQSAEPLLLDVPHVAGVLCATIWQVRVLIASGQLHASKLGHRWVVSRSEIERFVRAKEQEAAA